MWPLCKPRCSPSTTKTRAAFKKPASRTRQSLCAEDYDPATEENWFKRRDGTWNARCIYRALGVAESGDLRDHETSCHFRYLATLHMMGIRLRTHYQTPTGTITALSTMAIA